MADFIQVTPDFAVAGQLTEADFARAKAAGFRAVVNNRPDNEAPGQMTSADARRAAEAAGLAYFDLPVTGSTLRDGVAAAQAAFGAADGPVLAYCRTGTRSISLWALTQAGKRPADEIIGLGRAAGYDLSALRPALGARQG
ncbi:MAG: TIGR01244 family phosphatase [Hyphomonadaceae bacterium]|nr:TIGR01244 family phosphatase [Hyphomonadaceae bacterium]